MANFWFAVCKQKRNPKKDEAQSDLENRETDNNNDDGLYSKATLENIHHAINRNLQDAGRHIDITSDHTFTESNNAYKHTQRKGKGSCQKLSRNHTFK